MTENDKVGDMTYKNQRLYATINSSSLLDGTAGMVTSDAEDVLGEYYIKAKVIIFVRPFRINVIDTGKLFFVVLQGETSIPSHLGFYLFIEQL